MLEPEKQVTRPVLPHQTPWHPDYGLPVYYRMAALCYAEYTSPADAAEAFNVGRSTLYNWRARLRGELR